VTGRPLRVCLPLTCYPPDFGGWGIQFQQLLPRLRACGIEVRILTRRPAQEMHSPPPDDSQVLRILPAPGTPNRRLWGTHVLRSHLRQQAPSYDLVHGALADWEFYLNVPWMKRHGLPVLHEMVLLGGDDPAAILAERLGRWKLRLMSGIDVWVGIAEAFLPRLVQAGIPTERFRCIYPGIDTARYRPCDPESRRRLRQELGVPTDARVVVSVGALIARKGMDRLLEAWAWQKPRPGRDLLLLVGPASEAEGLTHDQLAHAEALRTRSESPELEGTVRIVGRVDRVEDFMRAADVFALLSLQEGFGIVIAEAMACGLPCVVSPLDGIAREIVREGQTGFVAQRPDDATAVGTILRRLLDDAKVRTELGSEAADAARARFSLDGRARQLAELYRSLVPAQAR
jgi:glycosyltransferase involved in cell wall biosynthesis